MKDKIVICSTPSNRYNLFYRMFVDSLETNGPTLTGVDWAAGHGMIRGEVIRREGNVIYLQFRTASV